MVQRYYANSGVCTNMQDSTFGANNMDQIAKIFLNPKDPPKKLSLAMTDCHLREKSHHMHRKWSQKMCLMAKQES